jgi:hypothetical protein
MAWVHDHWVWVHPHTLREATGAWSLGIEHVAFALIYLLLFSAADLGSLGLGESAARKEYDFLLTRPRMRKHFVWMAYLAGLAQLCLVALIPLAVAVTALYALTSWLCPDRLWLLSLGAFVLSMLVFSGAFALSVATGSSRNGFELVFSLLVVYNLIRQLDWRRFWRLPIYASGAYDWLLIDQHVHYLVLLLMLAATAVLPFLAQFRFERKDL